MLNLRCYFFPSRAARKNRRGVSRGFTQALQRDLRRYSAVYVIECVPNMDAATIAQRTGPLVAAIRKTHATTPLLLVEDRTSPNSFLLDKKRQRSDECRAALRKAFDTLMAGGVRNLHYLTGGALLAADGEDAVDGSHPTDLGFVHLADAMQPAIEPLLSK